MLSELGFEERVIDLRAAVSDASKKNLNLAALAGEDREVKPVYYVIGDQRCGLANFVQCFARISQSR